MTAANKIHEGHNVKRIREILGIEQDALAIDLEITQQAVSLLEQKETIDAPMLDKVAKALGVSADAIKNFSEDAAVNVIGNTVTNYNNAAVVNYYPTFNLIDKLIESYEENKKLYERMLKEKNELIKKLMKEK